MNSRFKELADKVWSLDTEPNPHFEICLQAFAELIVQECGSIADNSREGPVFPSVLMKKHFGIQ